MLSRINIGYGEPWFIIGDFNKVIYQHDKEGRRLRPSKQMGDFRIALQDNNIFDIGWMEQKFTWSNRHQDEFFTKERLDCVVANREWWEILGSQGV